LQQLAGKAAITVRRHPVSSSRAVRTLGWRPSLTLRALAGPLDDLIKLRPNVIRTYGSGLAGFAALNLRDRTGAPFLVSLHTAGAEGAPWPGWRSFLSSRALTSIDRLALRGADLVLPVYQSIVPYLRSIGVSRFEVVYNVINQKKIRRKDAYGLHGKGRLICVGRQFKGKNPEAILRALVELEDVELTLVGKGPLHDHLRRMADELRVSERVVFHPAIASDDVCALLSDHDIFVAHSEFAELSKTVLEAMLTGLPVVINRRQGSPVPELTTDICELVDGSPRRYRTAIRSLLDDSPRREQLGRTAARHAWDVWSPERTEAKMAAIYRRFLTVGYTRERRT
jgi:glycosyltransferase involved in cell wall biosynthesis